MPLSVPDPRLCSCGCGGELPPTTRRYPSGRVVKNVIIRFLPGHNGRKHVRYEVDPLTECWNWLLGTNDHGYGQFQINHGKESHGKKITETVMAHVHEWEKTNGKIPDGLELDHLCRNRLCINPAHLEPVTHSENMRRSSQAVLTVEVVNQCKQLRSKGYTFVDMAAMFGVHRTTISKAVNGVNWSDLC